MERYYSEVLSYIARSVGCKDKAQNIVQEAYTRLLSYHRSHPKQDRTQERALFFKAAKNIVIDQYRKNQPIAEPDETELIAPNFYEPEAKLASQQQLAILNRSIESLPLKSKQAFVLYKFKNLNQAQIAEEMGISVSMVEKHLATAMLACRQALKKQ
ncbi:RNA polymerase subunit sigma-24 [Pseudoalteromonas phenolica]|uniref:RNA polymerase subunit sigma-24 n=1 Tax=Pseudoalteromonas phenolica TaxID=161398 RepID=A0A5R9Q2V9_9GAMM|nr:sigma-70 family RNA polymerase sigma factor [Pseudoalteromonas phenolica]TLX47503.1 RNA polymerase subunit sigma-24 [Pseudoalteromonas phenolica]